MDKTQSEHRGVTDLSARQLDILSAVVQDYVKFCEPVGSKSLLSRHQLKVSSATIRNEMAELENLGYLEKPHTSAGRIPSDKGYRAYVDSLLELEKLSPKEESYFSSYFADRVSELKDLIHAAAGSLASSTQLTSLVLTPTYGLSTLKQVKILSIEPGKAIVVVVLSVGVVRDRVINVPNFLTSEQLNEIAQVVEEGLAGQQLQEITLLTVSDAGQRSNIPDPLLNQVLFETYIAIKQAENIDVHIKGFPQLLKQPEFADSKKANVVLDTISQNGLVAGYLSELDDDQKLGKQDPKPAFAIRIGQEITLAGLEDCSFVTTTYSMGDSVKGKIAVIGPKRMQYSKIISEISFVKKTINHKLREYAGQDGDSDRKQIKGAEREEKRKG